MRVRILAVLFVLTSATALAQSAPESYGGRPVTDITLFLERQPFNDPVIRDLIATEVGQPLSLAAVRESIAHIYSLGRFQDIQVEAGDAPNGGVLLRYNLIPIHAVERVEFRGSLGLSENQLRDTINERFGRRPPLARADEVSRTLERLYEDRGFFSASVRLESTELDDPPRTILTFNITAGPQARVRSIEVVGDPGTSRDDLLTRIGIVSGRPYERTRVNDRLAEHVQRLKKRGHLQAAANQNAQISEDGASADVTLDVRAGPIVEVAFVGDPIPAARRDELVPIEREGSVDEDLLEDSSQRIRDYLRQQGHCRGDVTVEPRESAGRLTIMFNVRKGPACRVAPDGVDVSGNSAIPLEEIRPLIQLVPGDNYVPSTLDAASAAVEHHYRTRGFAWVDVKTAENELSASNGAGTITVRPAIVIAEGPRASIGQIALTGATALSEAEIRRLLQLNPGMPYYEPTLRAARDAVELEYLNLGFTAAQVTFVPSVSEDKTRVDLTVRVAEGLQTIVDHVIIVGNRNTAEEVIRRELALRPGAPLGLRDLIESRSRLSGLGLFRRIDIRELEHGPPARRDVLITVEEAPATAVGYGGGLEITRFRIAGEDGAVEEIQLAPRGFFDIGRRNLGGRNRSVNLFTRISFRPSDAAESPENPGNLGVNEYRVVGTFRQPRAVRNADFMMTAAIEQGTRSSFNFTRKGITGEFIRRVTAALRTNVRYTISNTRTFDERLSEEEQAIIDRRFPQVRLSVISGAVSLDRRDDVVEPTRGTFLSAESSIAARSLGSEVGFLKTYLQGYWFKQLPRAPRVIFATRASIGLADGFEREVPLDPDNPPIEGLPETIEDLPASERFFAGGDTTIRGFALDTVGAPNTISPDGFPRGGNAVLIMNGELRVAVYKDFGAAVFVDGGNVFARVTQFDIGELRGSVGFGLRYRSPIGPVRIDLGFKLDRREFGGELEKRTGLHFSIGQAF